MICYRRSINVNKFLSCHMTMYNNSRNYGHFRNWQKRDLSRKRYVYFWVDGIYFNVRMEKENLCLLVIVGATADGRKEFVAIEDGYREDAQSWKELLLRVKNQGLLKGPELAIGDGALGFWKVFREVYGRSHCQRC